MSRHILFSGTVVANGGDRAIVEAQIELLSARCRGLAIDLSDNLPAVASRVMPSCQAVPHAYGELLKIRLPGITGRLARRLNPQRLLLAALVRRLSPWFARRLCSKREWELIARLGAYDAVVYCGGTSLVESYWLEPKFFELRLALALNVPVALMTQSLGPFTRPRNQRAVRALCAKARLVLLRDQRSLDNLRAIGASDLRCKVLPDIVMSMTDVGALQAIKDRRLGEKTLQIGVSVRELGNYSHFAGTGAGARFDAAVSSLVEYLVAQGHEICFISTCQGVPEYWTDDSAKAEQIRSGLPDEVRAKVQVDTADRSTAELRARLREFDILIATRLHAAILGLTAGTVVLPIAYEFKTHEAFASLGLKRYVLDAEKSDLSKYLEVFERFRREIDGLRDVTAENLASVSVEASQAGLLTVLSCHL